MAVTARSAARRAQAARGLPDLRAGDPRQAARLPRLGRRARRSRGRCSTRCASSTRRRTRTSTAASTRSRARDRRLRGRAREGRALRQRAVGARGDLHAQRDRGAQPRRVRLGPRQPRPRRPRRRHRARAPLELRPLAVHREADRRRVPDDPDRRRGRAATSTGSTRSRAAGNVKVVAANLVSNALGTINPIERLAAWAHEQGAIMVVDAAQAAPHRRVDVQALGCDFLALLGAQDVRAERHRRPLGPARAARGDGAVRARRRT